MQWLRSSSDKYHSQISKRFQGNDKYKLQENLANIPPQQWVDKSQRVSLQFQSWVPDQTGLNSMFPYVSSHPFRSSWNFHSLWSDFPHILVDILQQLGETRQKRSSPIMTQCRPASRNATGLLQHRDRVRVALRHKKFLFSSCLGRNIFVLFRSWKNFQSPKYVFYRYCLCYNIVKHRILAEYAFT